MEKKSMAEREKLITSEHIAKAADEIISPDYKAGKKYNNMNRKPKIFVYRKIYRSTKFETRSVQICK